jgi:hypothetical protein
MCLCYAERGVSLSLAGCISAGSPEFGERVPEAGTGARSGKCFGCDVRS